VCFGTNGTGTGTGSGMHSENETQTLSKDGASVSLYGDILKPALTQTCQM